MRAIEPGEPFDVQYGNGKKLTLYAISSRQERAMAKAEAAANESSNPDERWTLVKSCLRSYLPESKMADGDFETLTEDSMNLAVMVDVLQKANSTTHVSEEDEKKSGSPH